MGQLGKAILRKLHKALMDEEMLNRATRHAAEGAYDKAFESIGAVIGVNRKDRKLLLRANKLLLKTGASFFDAKLFTIRDATGRWWPPPVAFWDGSGVLSEHFLELSDSLKSERDLERVPIVTEAERRGLILLARVVCGLRGKQLPIGSRQRLRALLHPFQDRVDGLRAVKSARS